MGDPSGGNGGETAAGGPANSSPASDDSETFVRSVDMSGGLENDPLPFPSAASGISNPEPVKSDYYGGPLASAAGTSTVSGCENGFFDSGSNRIPNGHRYHTGCRTRAANYPSSTTKRSRFP